ncbi:uncharacterized protein TNCV_1042091 [Trichonephila clavipes]|nr:uncharacterized protein TNCV_1042091 [Trichonephila clavipes]
MAPHTVTPTVGAVCPCKTKARLRRSPRGLHPQMRLSSLLRLNLDSSLKTTYSTAVQFLRARRRWVGVKGSTRNGCRDSKCPSAKRRHSVREDTGDPSEDATSA